MKPKHSFGLAVLAVVVALLAFRSAGWLVLLYPGLLTLAGRPLGGKSKLALSLAFGCLFAGVFYRWVLAFGALPWLGLIMVRGLPWGFYFLPQLVLSGLGKTSQRCNEIVGGALGLGLVSASLLAGLTGIDWETPAACLTVFPFSLHLLPWLGLTGFALLLGGLSHALLLGDRVWRSAALVVGVVWLGLCSLPTPKSGSMETLRVALVQPGWVQNEKWEESNRVEAAQRLLDLTAQAAQSEATLVVWPETAWPYLGMRRRFTNTRRIGKLARQLSVDMLVSSIELEDPDLPTSSWRNSVSLVKASGRFESEYQKRRLAPFAEYIPLPQGWEQSLRKREPFSQISRYTPGNGSAIVELSNGRKLGLMVCYESMTPSMASEMAEEVDFFVVVTNDAPFAHPEPSEAHFRSGILRALETGRPLLQASNTGVTGAIDGTGRVLERTKPGFSGPDVKLCNLELIAR